MGAAAKNLAITTTRSEGRWVLKRTMPKQMIIRRGSSSRLLKSAKAVSPLRDGDQFLHRPTAVSTVPAWLRRSARFQLILFADAPSGCLALAGDHRRSCNR